jgi:linoleoyl-CoA desaturase
MDTIGQKPQFLRTRKDDFFLKIVREVHEKVLNDKKMQYKNIIKALGLVTAFFIFYSCILIFGNNIPLLFALYILMGFTMILIFVNSFHDASHGALFFTKKQNRFFCYVVDLFGSNSEIWIQRHLQLHHPYPNIQN